MKTKLAGWIIVLIFAIAVQAQQTAQTTRITVIDAPSNLGLRPPKPGKIPGVHKLAGALRSFGILSRLHATDGGSVTPPTYSPALDPKIGVRNAEALAAYSLKLSDAVQQIIQHGGFPVVLGGDCSILIGNMLALRRVGHFGLIFIDGHTDYATPQTSGTGGAAGMDLAIVTGRGIDPLTDLKKLKPYVQPQDVVAFGFEDFGHPEKYLFPDILKTKIELYSIASARKLGLKQAAEKGIEYLKTQGVSGFWIHLDADVLNEKIMPAVDSPNSGGMTFEELSEVLRIFLSSNLARGIDIAIYDPDLDPTGKIGKKFTDSIVSAFPLDIAGGKN